MSQIIVATDFSEVGTNAVHYACQMALERNTDIVIMHSYSIPLMFSDVPVPASFINDTQNDAEAEMTKLTVDLSAQYPTIRVTGEVVFGDILDSISTYASSNTRPWMIVVGNGANTEDSGWPDSLLVDAFRNLPYPVLAIPPGATYKPVKNICFAFDNKHTGNELPLLQLTGITQQFNAQLHVLNAQPGTHKGEFNEGIDMMVKDMLYPVHPKYHIVFDGNIDQAIEKFINTNKTDLLVIIPRKHSFFESLFHHSHTKAIAHRSHIPILALHDGV